jgi:hypothetical protein
VDSPGPRPKRLAAGRARALGLPTRGTTAPNRLRRMDRWIATELAARLRSADRPLVIDLGYGHSPTTAVELHARLSKLRPDVEVLGLEIDPDRVRDAQVATRPGLSFERGGFELAGRRPVIVRAANVLRQYPESEVEPAWAGMRAQLADGGAIVEATSDEYGRRCTWVLLEAAGPVSLTISCALEHLVVPSAVADRLVKALIHRNVAGEGIHRLLMAMDAAWHQAAPLGVFGPVQRWQAMCETVAEHWPVLSSAREHRLGDLTVAWTSVAPAADR